MATHTKELEENMLPFIQLEMGIGVILNGVHRCVAKDLPQYDEVVEAIKNGADADAVLAILEKDLSRVTEAVDALREQKITDDVTISGGLVLFRGEEVHNTLADRMLKQLDEGFNLVPMARFLANLMENPSYRSVEELYGFLEYGKMPITEDGCFLAYKAVNPDYTDIYTGTISNRIGEKPWMPRNKVDDNSAITCSRGYHVCSFDYLPCFAHNNGHVMICKINPRDVVSIPTDYNHTKMRVCTYEVVDEYEGYYTANRENVLTNTTVATDEEPFLVIIEGTSPGVERYARRSQAFEAAETALTYPHTETVTIKNGVTGVVLETLENEDFEGYEDEADYDDFDEEEEEEEIEPSYEIVSADDPSDFETGEARVYLSGLSDLARAKNTAFNAVQDGQITDSIVKVQDEDTGEVHLTLS
jgi:hypothetical protein